MRSPWQTVNPGGAVLPKPSGDEEKPQGKASRRKRQRFVKAWWRWSATPEQRETSHDLGSRAEGARMPKQTVSRQTQQAQNEERDTLREQRIDKILEAQQSQIQELTTHVSQMVEKIMQTVSEVMERVTRAESRNTSQAPEQERQERSVSGHAKRGGQSQGQQVRGVDSETGVRPRLAHSPGPRGGNVPGPGPAEKGKGKRGGKEKEPL